MQGEAHRERHPILGRGNPYLEAEEWRRRAQVAAPRITTRGKDIGRDVRDAERRPMRSIAVRGSDTDCRVRLVACRLGRAGRW